MSTSRLEAFSDGVIAVAITLLVLNINVPDVGPGQTLGHELAIRWPSYVAYAISFLTIGIIWVNHHAMIGRLSRADHSILILNLLLLMSLVLIPFGTSLMSTYLKRSHGQHLAAAVYAATMLALAITFSLLNRQILIRRAHLLRQPLPLQERRRIFRRAATGVVPYAIAIGLAPISAYATLILTGVLAAFYALPIASSS